MGVYTHGMRDSQAGPYDDDVTWWKYAKLAESEEGGAE